MDLRSKKEVFLIHNDLTCLVLGLVGQVTTVDLRNEASVTGLVDQVDGYMNIIMSDAVYVDGDNSRHLFDDFFVQARNVRYIHIPDDVRHFSSLKRVAVCISVDIVAGTSRRHSLLFKMKKSTFTVHSGGSFGHQDILRFSDYDCIGFDLDNTLVKYKLTELMTLEYDVLARYMVEVKGYDPKHLLLPFSQDIGFVQRCLFVDFERGNLIKLGAKGEVIKASHGTRFLSEGEIRDTYGPDKVWKDGITYMKDPLEAWRGPLATRVRPLLDFFDAPSALIFARIINTIDESGDIPNKYNVWPDILDGLTHMFSPENFDLGEGYFHSIRSDVGKYVHPVDHQVVDWLKSLKHSGKKLFLLTGSGMSFASIVAEHSLGRDWRSLFDIVISIARKPWFFLSDKEEKPFIKYSEPGIVKENNVQVPQLNCKFRYEQGSWDGLCIALGDEIGKENGGKVLYVGDNIIQDIYSPVKYTKCQSVAICEEMSMHMSFEGSEKLVDKVLHYSDWGSFFAGHDIVSYWSDILSKYSKLCVPSINACAAKPIDYPFKIGFYPDSPPS